MDSPFAGMLRRVAKKNGFKVPTTEEILRKVHGIEAGVYECVACRQVYEISHYPAGWCVDCKCHLPAVCPGDDCDLVIYPQKDRRTGRWYPGPLMCQTCEHTGHVGDDADIIVELRNTFPAGLLSKVSKDSYDYRPTREIAEGRAAHWIESVQTEPHCLIVKGPEGGGKSVLAVHAMVVARKRGQVSSMTYVSWPELSHAISGLAIDGQKGASFELLRKMRMTRALLIDDAPARMRQTQLDRLSSILHERDKYNRPTIVTVDVKGWSAELYWKPSRCRIAGVG